MDINGVAYPHPDEGSWHLSVEGPVTELRSFCEAPLNFDTEQVYAHRLRHALAEGCWQVSRIARNVGFNDSLVPGALA